MVGLAASLGLQGMDGWREGGRGDRRHSGGPTRSDTTQGASAADCRARRDSRFLHMQITHSRFSPKTIISLIIMTMSNNKHSNAIPPLQSGVVSTSKSVRAREGRGGRNASQQISALGGHSGDPLYPSLSPPSAPAPLLSPTHWPRAALCSGAPHHSLGTANSEYVERILTGASKASGPARDSSSLTSFFTASARSDGVRGHPGRRWIHSSYF